MPYDLVLIDPVSLFDQRRLPNLGLVAIDSYLGLRGFETALIEMGGLRDYLDSSDVFGVSVWDHSYGAAVRITRAIRKRRPDAVVIWGGWAAMARPEQVLRDNPGVDYVILQDGERRMELLLRSQVDPARFDDLDGIAYRREDGAIELRPARERFDPDLLPVPRPGDEMRHRRHDGNGIVYVELARGCYGRCSYCQHLSKMRFRDPGKVAEEIAFWYGLGNRHFYIGNDNSIAKVTHLERLVDALEQRRLDGIRIWLTGRPNDVLKGLPVIERVFASPQIGLHAVEMGIESDSAAMLKRLRRGLTPEINRRAMDALFALRERYSPDTQINANIILFPHWEMTIDDFVDNVRFIGDYGCSRDTFSLQLYGVAGTPLWDEMSARGFLGNDAMSQRITSYPYDDPDVERLFARLVREPLETLLRSGLNTPGRMYRFQHRVHDKIMDFLRTGNIREAVMDFIRDVRAPTPQFAMNAGSAKPAARY
jgi:hypothetical protein